MTIIGVGNDIIEVERINGAILLVWQPFPRPVIY